MTDIENIIAMQAITLIVLVFLCCLLADLKESHEESEKWLSSLISDNRATLMKLDNRAEEKKGIT